MVHAGGLELRIGSDVKDGPPRQHSVLKKCDLHHIARHPRVPAGMAMNGQFRLRAASFESSCGELPPLGITTDTTARLTLRHYKMSYRSNSTRGSALHAPMIGCNHALGAAALRPRVEVIPWFMLQSAPSFPEIPNGMLTIQLTFRFSTAGMTAALHFNRPFTGPTTPKSRLKRHFAQDFRIGFSHHQWDCRPFFFVVLFGEGLYVDSRLSRSIEAARLHAH